MREGFVDIAHASSCGAIEVDIRGTGSTSSLSVSVRNLTANRLVVTVEPGVVFTPANPGTQRMMSWRGEAIAAVPPHKSARGEIPAMCIDASLQPPTSVVVLSPSPDPPSSSLQQFVALLRDLQTWASPFYDAGPQYSDGRSSPFYREQVETKRTLAIAVLRNPGIIQRAIWYLTDGMSAEDIREKFLYPRLEADLAALRSLSVPQQETARRAVYARDEEVLRQFLPRGEAGAFLRLLPRMVARLSVDFLNMDWGDPSVERTWLRKSPRFSDTSRYQKMVRKEDEGTAEQVRRVLGMMAGVV